MAESLLADGSDDSIRDFAGKTVGDWAEEVKKESEWNATLSRAREKLEKGKIAPNTLRILLFATPFLVLPIGVICFAILPWYMGALANAGLVWGMMTAVNKVLGRHAQKKIIKTPFPTAVFQASAYYVLTTWLLVLLPSM